MRSGKLKPLTTLRKNSNCGGELKLSGTYRKQQTPLDDLRNPLISSCGKKLKDYA